MRDGAPVFAISDLHAGDGGARDNFARIDPTGEVRLFDWRRGRPVPNETVPRP